MRARSRRRSTVAPFDGLLLLALLVACFAAVLGILFQLSWGGEAPGGDDGAATFARSVIASGVTGLARVWFDGAFIILAIAVPIVTLPLCCVGRRARWVGLALGCVLGACAVALGVGVAASGRPEEVTVGAAIGALGLVMATEGVLIAVRRASLAGWLVLVVVAAVVVLHVASTAQLTAIAAGPLAAAVVVLCVPLVLVGAGVAVRARRLPRAAGRARLADVTR